MTPKWPRQPHSAGRKSDGSSGMRGPGQFDARQLYRELQLPTARRTPQRDAVQLADPCGCAYRLVARLKSRQAALETGSEIGGDNIK